MKIRTVIAPTERGLMIRNKAIVDILEPGVYWSVQLASVSTIEVVSITDTRCDYTDIVTLTKTNPALADRHFVAADIGSTEVGLVFEDNRLVDILAPGTRAMYWKGLAETRIDCIDTTIEARVATDIARQIGRTGALARRASNLNAVLGIDVQEKQVGFFYDEGRLVEMLEPGYYLYWKFNRKFSGRIMDVGMTMVEVSGQEILTRDRVSLRLNLSALYRIDGPAEAEAALTNVSDFVYRELQLALRQAVGTRTLDQLLADKTSMDSTIAAEVQVRLRAVGIELINVGVKDVILPGDMKEILNRVVVAEKTAQANNIRRREETAATRSLLNTAKLMADNPVLVRLKELEALEKVTANVDKITVFGGMDGVMKELVRIDQN